MNRNGVPFGGIALTGALTLLGVILNLFVPEEAFNIALDLSALGIIATWAMIVACQLQLWRWEQKGILQRPKFRLPGTPLHQLRNAGVPRRGDSARCATRTTGTSSPSW